ncbi:MAG: Asp23/Gls24 family envelope stress response protein [Clostridiales bacterium]|nr:Asp23/Gls24 family envelope stress response protein [Clostridiales bacterium]
MEENNEVLGNEISLETNNDTSLKISDEVVAIIAGIATNEVKGVAGMSGGLVGGISEILGKKNFSKGIKVEVGDKVATIEIYIIVEYGVRIPDVAWEIQNKVKKSVEEMTGLNVLKVNIHVQGVKIGEKEVVELPQEENNAQ